MILIAVPHDHFLAKPAHMHHYRRESREKLYQVVSVGHGIHAVECRSVEFKKCRSVVSVERICCSSQRARSQRTIIHPVIYVAKPSSVATKHLKVSSHMMCKSHGLSFLKMCKSRHICSDILFHYAVDDLHQIFHQVVYLYDLIPDI